MIYDLGFTIYNLEVMSEQKTAPQSQQNGIRVAAAFAIPVVGAVVAAMLTGGLDMAVSDQSTSAYLIIIWRLWPKVEGDYRV